MPKSELGGQTTRYYYPLHLNLKQKSWQRRETPQILADEIDIFLIRI